MENVPSKMQLLASSNPKCRSVLPSFYPILRIAAVLLTAVSLVGSWVGTVRAGLSSSDVVVVVNSGSLNSRTLANHFVSLRRIPAVNVVVLDEVPNSETVSVEDFRTKILRPLVLELQRRRLLDHIQCIAYSADFPTAIDISADLNDIKDRHFIFTPVASINSLTYLYAQVLNRDPGYISLNSNYYARRGLDTYFTNPGGASTHAAWEQIQQDIKTEQHAAAADGLEKIFTEQPHQYPVAYLAAAEAALATDKPRALRLLRSAVSAGWYAGRFLKNDSRFAALRDDPEFQVIELTLDDSIKELQPATGFDARQPWAPNGVAASKPELGQRYLLSTVLGVTRGAGTSLPQAIAAIQRSASADYTHPEGGFYFALTNDVRTTTRQWGFIGAVDDLQQMGFEAEVVHQPLPERKPRVLGAQIGTPSFDWPLSGSELAPGAIAENLTSLGGVMSVGSGQTNLSELIKAGAAGSSGAVTEPYSLQEKFPHPNLYVQYARGASLAEAFYLSVAGPYQLLVVGDPLCQPFSNAPQVSLDNSLRFLEVGESLNIELDDAGINYEAWLDSPMPAAKRRQPLAASALRALLDGINPQAGAMKRNLKISTKNIAQGYHELILQFAAEGPLALRSSVAVAFWIGPRNALQLSLSDRPGPTEKSRQISFDAQKIKLRTSASVAERISVWHDSEQLATAPGNTAEFSIELSSLGMGPVRLHSRADLADGTFIQSQPIWVDVLP